MDCSRIGASTFSNSSGGGLAAHAISARASRFSTQSGTAASIRPSQDLCPSRERATGMPSQTAGATLCAVAEGTCSPRCSGREGSCVEIGAPFFILICLTKPGHRGLQVRNRRQQGSHEFALPTERAEVPPAAPRRAAAAARAAHEFMTAMVQAQPTATGAKSIADLQKLLATMKLASSRSRRVDRQLDDVSESVNSFKATTSTQGEKLAALEKSYFTLLERVVGSEGDKAESGRGKPKSKAGGKGGGGKGGNDSSGGPGASPDGKNAIASPDGKSRDAKSDAKSKAGSRSASKGGRDSGSRADTGAGAGGAGTESRVGAESPRGGEEGDSRKGKGRGKGGGNGGGRRGEDDLPRDLPDGSAEAKPSMPHESDDDTPGKDGGGRGSGKGGRSNSRRAGKGKEGGAADPDPNAAPLSPIRPNAITSSS